MSLADVAGDIISSRIYCEIIARAFQMYIAVYVSSAGAVTSKSQSVFPLVRFLPTEEERSLQPPQQDSRGRSTDLT